MLSAPGAQPGSVGRLVLDVTGPVLAPKLYTRTPYVPKVSINGQPLIEARRGQTAFDLPPGPYHLNIGIGTTATRSFHYGQAQLAVTVLLGQITTVYYRAPAMIGVAGAVGLTPQTTPGRVQRALLVAVLGVLLLAALLTVLR